MPRSLVLTPGVAGRDGVSCLSRELVSALVDLEGPSEVSVWSLNDPRRPADLASGAGFRGAGGGRHRITAWAIREGLCDQKGRFVFVLHAHLSPLALPLVARGARLAQFLIGIEVWKPLTRLQRLAISRASLTVGISAYTVKRFQEANPSFDGLETLVCHPGIPAEPDGSVSSRDRSFALIVGRMSSAERYKGHDQLIELWPRVLEQVGFAELRIVGDGDDRARLEAKARSLHLEDRVLFLGELSEAELRNAYLGCAFFVMPSRNEGFGLVFLEAMRCGRPCVGSTGAAAEILEDGESGYAVEPDDSSRLFEVIVGLFRDSELRESMGRKALARFRAHFSREAFRERLKGVLGGMRER